MDDREQKKEMTQEEIRRFIAENMPEGMMAVIHFDGRERKDEHGKTGRS